MHPAIIIGGGISGLSAAWYLSRAGIRAPIVESRPRLGGVITTDHVEGCVVEGGPDSFLSTKPAAMDLLRELGLEDQVIGSNDHQRITYIRRRGRLVPLPDGLMMMVPTRVWPMARTGLLGWVTKVRMAFEYFRRPVSHPDRSVAELVRDHFGQEAVDYLAEPLLSGVYGGDPERLSAASVLPRFVEIERTVGSLTRGMLASRQAPGAGTLFRTLRDGLGQMVSAIETQLHPEVVRGEAETLIREGEGYRIRVGGAWLDATRVILAGPAHMAARLLAGLDPELSRQLGGIEYSSSMTVAIGYRRDKIGHPLNGFGFLVPRRERGRMVACTWVGTKFAHRVPEHMAMLRCFLGGTRDEAVLGESDSAITEVLQRELREIMGIGAEPSFVRISRWPRSMAQYTVGHAARVTEIQARTAAHRGLYLAGNAFHGIGIPDCIRAGREAASLAAREG